jgi:hypothetical protein
MKEKKIAIERIERIEVIMLGSRRVKARVMIVEVMLLHVDVMMKLILDRVQYFMTNVQDTIACDQ